MMEVTPTNKEDLRKAQKQNITKCITIIQNIQTEIYNTWQNKQVIEHLDKALETLYKDYGLVTHIDNHLENQIQEIQHTKK